MFDIFLVAPDLQIVEDGGNSGDQPMNQPVTFQVNGTLMPDTSRALILNSLQYRFQQSGTTHPVSQRSEMTEAALR